MTTAAKPDPATASTPTAVAGWSLKNKRVRLLVLAVLLLILTAVLISGLDTRMRLIKPAGYAEVEAATRASRFVQKLISPEGNVVAVRRFDNPDDKTGLDYWATALELEKTQKDGMTLVGREELTTNKGQKGMLFDFEVGERPSHIRYLIALFVVGDAIYTVEAGGSPGAITRDRETIVATMKTLGE